MNGCVLVDRCHSGRPPALRSAAASSLPIPLAVEELGSREVAPATLRARSGCTSRGCTRSRRVPRSSRSNDVAESNGDEERRASLEGMGCLPPGSDQPASSASRHRRRYASSPAVPRRRARPAAGRNQHARPSEPRRLPFGAPPCCVIGRQLLDVGRVHPLCEIPRRRSLPSRPETATGQRSREDLQHLGDVAICSSGPSSRPCDRWIDVVSGSRPFAADPRRALRKHVATESVVAPATRGARAGRARISRPVERQVRHRSVEHAPTRTACDRPRRRGRGRPAGTATDPATTGGSALGATADVGSMLTQR